VNGIVFEKVRERFGVGQVVDAQYLEFRLAFKGGANNAATDSTKSVNQNFHLPFSFCLRLQLRTFSISQLL
jgi:hypothetical protein